jgi:hypothetical protein
MAGRRDHRQDGLENAHTRRYLPTRPCDGVRLYGRRRTIIAVIEQPSIAKKILRRLGRLQAAFPLWKRRDLPSYPSRSEIARVKFVRAAGFRSGTDRFV